MYESYTVETIKTFKLEVSVELLKFLKFEGKTKVVKDAPVSPLEHAMYSTIHKSIEKALDMSVIRRYGISMFVSITN